jgi:hypothetical protein
MKHAPFPPLAPRNIEELLFHMPTVAKTASTEWAKGFALSVVQQSRRRGWRPSDKQVAMMRTMVSELFTVRRSDDDDLSLIE